MYLTAKELADKFQWNPQSVTKKIKRGEIPAIKGRKTSKRTQWLISSEWLDRLLNK